MDVAILAGGLGRRLKGTWDKPKCLVPLYGKPLLERLIGQVRRLRPGRITILLGAHDAEAVLSWLQNDLCPIGWIGPPFRVSIAPAQGTAYALRQALPGLRWPLLVLNGDTLPLYPLAGLAIQYGCLQRTVVAVCEGRNAGACVLGSEAFADIQTTDHGDLDTYLFEASQYRVPGYFDVGTPDNFHKAQHFKGEDLDSYEDAVPR